MKRMKYIVFICILLLTVLIAFYLGYVNAEKKSFLEPLVSPSGNYECIEMRRTLLQNQARYVQFAIFDVEQYNQNGDRIFFVIPNDYYVALFKLVVEWGKEDTLWIYSSDIGMQCWVYKNSDWTSVDIDSYLHLAPSIISEIYEEIT